MILYNRCPQLMRGLIGLVFILVLLFASLYAFELGLMTSRLAGLLDIEEVHYEKMLERRQALITKWGPTADKIESFPTRGEDYTLWDFFLPSFKCPHRIERVGMMGDGGKWVCGLERIASKENCVVYTFGIGKESSFEAEVLQAAPGCEVYGYDFSVNSFGPEIELDADLKRRSHFFPYALGPLNAYSSTHNVRMYKLRTLMERNGHDFIDVLKIDIEGYEFQTLEVFIDSFHGKPLPFGQLQLEMHVLGGVEWEYFPRFLKWWEKLETAGLRPFFSEPNLVYVNIARGVRPDVSEYSFINVRGTHELITDYPRPYPRISQERPQ